MKNGITADTNNIAFCGLYCGACRSYLKGNCTGCKENSKANWCKVRICCIDNQYQSCADCKEIPLNTCKKFNNPISKIIGFFLNSSRQACINCIKEDGYDSFAEEMTKRKSQSLPRKVK